MVCTGRVGLPPGSSGLTAAPNDDFDDESAWVELYSVETTADAAGFWYVMSLYTRSQHWNRTIFEMTVVDEETVPGDSPHTGRGPPPASARYSALRRLCRKAPAPVGGGIDGSAPTHEAQEWTTQYVRTSDEAGHEHQKHIAVFGLVVPESVRDDRRYFPYQYPRVRCYRYIYEELSESAEGNLTVGSADESEAGKASKRRRGILKYSVIPLGDGANATRDYATVRKFAVKSAEVMVTHLRKRAERYDTDLGESTYVKRVVHDRLVSERAYRRHYDRMKLRYSFWVEQWTECTDPVKFVYEELSIAAWLCAVWEQERLDDGTEDMQTFVEVGAGNGFLTYCLRSEGHMGIGIDLQKREIWDKYPPDVTAALRHEKIDPETFDCSGYDWILGNHSDELSPWVPVLAARCQRDISQRPMCGFSADDTNGETQGIKRARRRAHPRFFLLPCCFFDFDERKLAYVLTLRSSSYWHLFKRVPRSPVLSQNLAILTFVGLACPLH